ncbi:MAG: GntR family transcriptional regulator [Chloroflexi bacterium]|nr:GntR family transcriptional regulator [Chloroflexota bacterium]
MRSPKIPALSAEVFNTLKERIIHWEYSPAHRLTEEELSEEFGVSRSPVREALQMLVENNLVAKEPYKGYTVRQPDMKEIQDLYEVRQALELFIVEWLAVNSMDDAEWTALHMTWTNITQELPLESDDFARHDEAFHEKLAECTGNQAIAHYLHNVNERLHFIRMTDITTPARLCATCEQHLSILDCIRRGDVETARLSMKMNIEGGRQKVEQAVKEALTRSFLHLLRGE